MADMPTHVCLHPRCGEKKFEETAIGARGCGGPASPGDGSSAMGGPLWCLRGG